MNRVKKPVFEPFNRTSGLELIDPDMVQVSTKKNYMDCSLEELLKEQVETEEAIADAQLIVDLELESGNRDLDSIKTTNQRIGQLKTELHAIKKQIRSLRKIEREAIAV